MCMNFSNLAILCIFFFSSFSYAQDISSSEVLDKAIAFHDPENKWSGFNDTFKVLMEMPGKAERVSAIHINLQAEYFYIKAVQDSIEYEYTVNKDKCGSSLNAAATKIQGTTSLRETCKKAKRYRDYYTYLYGLPMKLKDKSTILDPLVEKVEFKGNPYLVINVSYKSYIGTDIWKFYFNPKTYALEVYQFFKSDGKGNVEASSGEYILLSKIEEINGIKMPKIRQWYYNKDDAYLGTDTLSKS